MVISKIKGKILINISNALSSSLNLEETLGSIFRVLSETLEMERGTITLVDPITNELKIAVAHGLTKEEKERGRYKIGEGVTGKVVETGAPMVVTDAKSNPLFLNKTKARKGLEDKNFTFLCVPIKVSNKVIGALSVDRLFEKDVSYEEDLNLLTIIASMVGQAVKVRELAEKDKQAVVSENVMLRRELKGKYKFDNIIYSSSAIHYNSARVNKPFVKVACAALPESLLESELFGYERGAFTGALDRKIGRFELADQGTIFLDEIGDLTPATQVKLLRVLQEREFERLGGTETIKINVRVICATHRDLDKMVREDKFREDLYYRINVFSLVIPPLRDRKEDISLLVEHFIKKYSKGNNKKLKGISKAALNILMNHNWQGNVRELENVVERAVVLCKKDLITPQELPPNLVSKEKLNNLESGGITLPEIVEALESQKIKDALEKCKTQRNAAKFLGITERMLGYKRQKYKIGG